MTSFTWLAIGLAQGIALYALQRAQLAQPTQAALFHFVVVAPLAWFLAEGAALRGGRRALAALGIGGLLGALGWHGADVGLADLTWFGTSLATAILGLILVTFIGAWDPATRSLPYSRLFELAWRNALVVPAAAALTGIFWLLLWAAAWLLVAIGPSLLAAVLREDATQYIASAGVFALALQLALRRAAALAALRHFWLSLNTLFLPLALVLALVSVAATAFLGVDSLFATKRAATFLFWFTALAILFLNAAYQDGAQAPPLLPATLARLVPWAWLAMPVLALLGAWALALRVQQHGWSPDRVWGALVGLMAVVYACGYAASLLQRQPWMAMVARTNVAAAVLLAVALVTCLGPVADPRRLSVASQLARLQSGAATAADFDFAFLAREGGRYGREALEQLANANADAAVRRGAAQALAQRNEPVPERHDPEAAAAALQGVRVLPPGQRADPELLRWLARANADWYERACVANSARCMLWLVDTDGKGKRGALLLWQNGGFATATLYAREDTGWRRQGTTNTELNVTEWSGAIEAGQVRWLPPRWPDLEVRGKRLQLR